MSYAIDGWIFSAQVQAQVYKTLAAKIFHNFDEPITHTDIPSNAGWMVIDTLASQVAASAGVSNITVPIEGMPSYTYSLPPTPPTAPAPATIPATTAEELFMPATSNSSAGIGGMNVKTKLPKFVSSFGFEDDVPYYHSEEWEDHVSYSF